MYISNWQQYGGFLQARLQILNVDGFIPLSVHLHAFLNHVQSCLALPLSDP